MQYSSHASLRISRLGMGTYSLSGVYGLKDHKLYKKVIEEAYHRGITFFDTSDSYGTEDFLGQVVKPFRHQICLCTKLGVKKDLSSHLSYHAIMSSVEKSLKRLGSDYLDIYLVHFHDPNTPIQETVEALEDLVQGGKIRTYGLGHLPKEKVEEYYKYGNPSFLLMELNVATTKAKRDLLPLCLSHGQKGIAFSITGRSILTGKYQEKGFFGVGDIRNLDPLFHYHRKEWALKVLEKLKEIGSSYGKTPVQVAICWVLSQDGIICGLMGPSTLEHLDENLGGVGWELKEADGIELEEYLGKGEGDLREKDMEFIKMVLTSPLQLDKIFLQLIYVMEVSLLLGFVEEGEVVPLFRNLMLLERRGGLEADYRRLQQELLGLVEA